MRLTLAISAILLAALASEPRTAWGQMGGMSSSSSSSSMFGSSSRTSARASRPARAAPSAVPSARAWAFGGSGFGQLGREWLRQHGRQNGFGQHGRHQLRRSGSRRTIFVRRREPTAVDRTRLRRRQQANGRRHESGHVRLWETAECKGYGTSGMQGYGNSRPRCIRTTRDRIPTAKATAWQRPRHRHDPHRR